MAEPRVLDSTLRRAPCRRAPLAAAVGGVSVHSRHARSPSNCVVCFAAVNGGWSAWSQCKGYCSGATQSRSCTNPSPANGGAACAGSSESDCSMPGCAQGRQRLIACVATIGCFQIIIPIGVSSVDSLFIVQRCRLVPRRVLPLAPSGLSPVPLWPLPATADADAAR
jgi:hypothetical protein